MHRGDPRSRVQYSPVDLQALELFVASDDVSGRPRLLSSNDNPIGFTSPMNEIFTWDSIHMDGSFRHAMASSTRRARVREVLPQLYLGRFATGLSNTMTDVPGVLVSTHSIHNSPSLPGSVVHTGVTVVRNFRENIRLSFSRTPHLSLWKEVWHDFGPVAIPEGLDV